MFVLFYLLMMIHLTESVAVNLVVERPLVSTSGEIVDTILHDHLPLWGDTRWVFKKMCARVGERVELRRRLAIELLAFVLVLVLYWSWLLVMKSSLWRSLLLLIDLLLLALKVVLSLLLVLSKRGRRLLSTREFLFSFSALLVLDPVLFLLETALLGLEALDLAPVLVVLAPLGFELEPILLLDLLLERVLDLHLLLELASRLAIVLTTSFKANARWIGSETATRLLLLAQWLLVLLLILILGLLVLVIVLGESLFLLLVVSIILLIAIQSKRRRLQWRSPVTQPYLLLLAWELLRLGEELRVAVSLRSKVRIEAPTVEALLLLLLGLGTIVVVLKLGLISNLWEALKCIAKPHGRHLLRLVVSNLRLGHLTLASGKVRPVLVAFLTKPIKETLTNHSTRFTSGVMEASMTRSLSLSWCWVFVTRSAMTVHVPVALLLELSLLHLLSQSLRVGLLSVSLFLLLARSDGVRHAALVLLLASHWCRLSRFKVDLKSQASLASKNAPTESIHRFSNDSPRSIFRDIRLRPTSPPLLRGSSSTFIMLGYYLFDIGTMSISPDWFLLSFSLV